MTFSSSVGTAGVTLPYYSPMPVTLNVETRYQAKAGAPASFGVEAVPACEVNKSTFGLSYCPLTQRVQLQSKIKGKWKQVGLFKLPSDPANGGIREITIKHPKGKLYRFYLPGNHAYKKTVTKSFKTSPVRSEN